MFVHPNCGCSKASLGELSWLMNACQGSMSAYVLLLDSVGNPTNLLRSDLWRQAAAIPGVRVATDDDGREARLFGVETSGEVVLYEADGRLRFRGGITVSRGQMGNNRGCAAVQALVHHKPSPVTQTPVFGCPLFNNELAAKR